MGYGKLVGLSPEERREAMKTARQEWKDDLPPAARFRSMSEGRVSPEVKQFMDEWADTDLANDETPNEKKQRAKNRKAGKTRSKSKNKHKSYWNRPTENEAIAKVVGKKRSK